MTKIQLLKQTALGILLLTFIVGVIPFAYVGSFTRIMADSFCSVVEVRTMGIWGAWKNFYIHWSGRYAGQLIEYLVASTEFSFLAYLPGLYLFFWIIGLAWAIYQIKIVDGKAKNSLISVTAASLLVFTTLASMPNFADVMFHVIAAHLHLLVLPIYSVFLGIFFRLLLGGNNLDKLSWLYTIFGAFLLLLTSGFNEIASVVQLSLMGLFCLGIWIVSPSIARKLKFQLAVLFIVQLIGVSLMVVAPGNAFRQSNFPEPNLLQAIKIAVLYSLAFVKYTLKESLLNLLLVFGFFFWFGQNGLWPINPKYIVSNWSWLIRSMLWIPILLLGTLYVGFLPPAYVWAGGPPDRAYVFYYFLLFCGVAIWSYFAGQIFHRLNIPNYLGREYSLWRAGAIVVYFICCANVLFQAGNIINGAEVYKAYSIAWDQRDHLIREARQQGATRVSVPELPNPIGVQEISNDETIWVNTCASDYYGIRVKVGPFESDK